MNAKSTNKVQLFTRADFFSLVPRYFRAVCTEEFIVYIFLFIENRILVEISRVRHHHHHHTRLI